MARFNQAHAQENETLFTLINVDVIRGKRQLLCNLNMVFTAGEFIALAGENGCGKSSLLTVLGGLAPLEKGTLLFKGQLLSEISMRDLAEYRAVMLQSASTPFGFLVDEILQLARHHIIDSPDNRHRIISEVAEQFDITHLLSRNIQTLSGGERQRVFLSKAILQLLPVNPQDSLVGKLLLLDEPTSALDLRHQKLVMQQLVSLSKQGLCIVCVSHDLNLISPYCSRMLLLAEQGCIADDKPENALTIDTLARCYHTQLNLIRNQEHDVFVTH
ncbi:ATP-binding cassette domain-containing protein [Alteromonas sp. CI.11.F.A3]|uniref:ATP-binding cassette domain-containing protein n=1 Tax=Alteromonas sp. CI.11.F.A3 TaxID=3079555 RepID=UPI002942F5C2|nr:ATP-binding cassette domain-containing protein [Alteromonas sp. CI.11.F.A3]WOI37872.1 ATP-binding cassette domain-containing protein [Alteromonas sp. CI.11.F.A3]